MLIIAGAMILLPLAYLSLIVLVGYGVYYHAVEHTWLYATHRGGVRSQVFLFVAYLAPFLIGPLLIIFMLKPIFARRAHEREPLTLDRSQEPLLYEVLERLCETIGAPMPREIEVDCQLNAAAGFRPGIVSFLGRHMSLVIGLPIAAGMPMNEFMGVIAHELGHFSQGFGMRLSYVVRSINEWFGRVVYERDAWDEELAASSRSVDLRLGIFLYVARLGIWVNRKVLWVLMVIGHCICCAFLRQMEYDADRVAADVVGSDAYTRGLKSIHLLSAAEAKAVHDLAASWRERRLPDNVPLLIAEVSRKLTSEDRRQISEIALKERTGIVSTHPTLARRLRAVERRASPGVFGYDAPATALFANFKMIANAVTLTYYRRVVGLDVRGSNLFSTEDMVRQQSQKSKDITSTRRYFGDCSHLYLPVTPMGESIGPPADPRASVAGLKKLRAQFDAAAGKYAGYYREYAVVQDRLRDIQVVELLRSAGFKRIDKSSVVLPKLSDQTIPTVLAADKARLDELSEKLRSMTELLRKRLTIALQLACIPAVEGKLRLEESPTREIARMLPVLRMFETTSASLPGIAKDLAAAAALIQNAPQGADVDDHYPKLLPILKRLIRDARSAIEGARFSFEGVPYPFEHASGAISVSEYLACRVTSETDFVDVLMASNETMDRLVAVYSRCLSRLVFIAERVERAVGLPPAADPETGAGDAPKA